MPVQREETTTMAQYLLSVHSVDGEVREPMTDEEMQQFMERVGALEDEMKSAGAWLFSGRLHEPDTALALVEELKLDHYHAFHATRADLLHRLGRDSEAAAAYERAAAMAPTEAERDFLRLGGRAARVI